MEAEIRRTRQGTQDRIPNSINLRRLPDKDRAHQNALSDDNLLHWQHGKSLIDDVTHELKERGHLHHRHQQCQQSSSSIIMAEVPFDLSVSDGDLEYSEKNSAHPISRIPHRSVAARVSMPPSLSRVPSAQRVQLDGDSDRSVMTRPSHCIPSHPVHASTAQWDMCTSVTPNPPGLLTWQPFLVQMPYPLIRPLNWRRRACHHTTYHQPSLASKSYCTGSLALELTTLTTSRVVAPCTSHPTTPWVAGDQRCDTTALVSILWWRQWRCSGGFTRWDGVNPHD
jgi:hypothetical protein